VDDAVIRYAVGLACRAPSLHNSQPWRWIAHNSTVQLFLDPHQIARAADGSGRQAVLSCGVALDHLMVAMAASGCVAEVEVFPNPDNLDHLATVEFHPGQYVTDAQRDRADAILRRRTDRLPFAAPTGWADVEPVLRAGLGGAEVYLDVLTDAARPVLADASQLTESLRLYDSTYHTELDWWTHSFAAGEGIPDTSLISALESDRVAVGRLFPVSGHADRNPEVADDESRILVLSTDENTYSSALSCGLALSSVLLDATSAGLASCTLTHLTEHASSRGAIGGLTGRRAFPQVLVRVGVAPPLDLTAPATPRLRLQDVLEFR
jgi:hypothetical protein